MLFYRSAFACLFLTGYMAIADWRGALSATRRMGWAGVATAVCFAASMSCFLLALGETSVANVRILQATAPIISAILAWAFLGEALTRSTIAAIAVTLAGVVIMVSDSLASGRILGDLLALATGILFSLTIVLVRTKRDLPMTPATTLATLLAALAAWPMAGSLSASSGDLMLLGLFGVGQMGLALICFTSGARLLPAADSALVTLLEVVAAPIWVWLAFGEMPSSRTLLGGAIVLAAVCGHALIERRRLA
jgi:drug/metabolite transporter (DMT)-like permease